MVTGKFGIIENKNYTNNIHQSWEISANCTRVHVWPTMFDIETNADKLFIDEHAVSGLSVSYYTENEFEVTFMSDFSVTDNGFVLNWECADPILQTGTNGTISMENYTDAVF